MSRGRMLSLVLALFAASCLAGLLALRELDVPPSGDWGSRVAACAALMRGVSPSGSDQRAFEECLQAQWQAAFDVEALGPFNEALLAQQEVDPGFGGVCHLPGHRAGRYAFAQSRSIGDLIALAAVDDFACDNGFVHGAMDGFARSGIGPADLALAYAACESLSRQARQNCVDGSGHATWQVTHDWDAALSGCAGYASPADASNCVGGVVMQMFTAETDGSRPPDFEVSQASQVIPRLCGQVDVAKYRQMSDACYQIGSRFMSKEALDITERYDSQSEQLRSPGDEVNLEQVLEAWREAFGTCERLGESQRSNSCKEGLANSVVWVARHPATREAVCASLPAQYADMCRAAQAR